jgi:hypothetical protein
MKKIIGIVAAAIVAIAGIAALSYYWFARFETPHIVAMAVTVVFIFLAWTDDDAATAGFFVVLALIALACILFLPKTGDTRTECLEWSVDEKQIKKEYRGTTYVEPPAKYCVEEQKQIRIGGEWKAVVGEK